MEKHNNNNTTANKPVSGQVKLGLPREMNIVDICRGMQTGWPQLVAAMKTLEADPQFCGTFTRNYASGKGLAIGNAQQLLEALAIDPSLLTKPTPPRDAYARSVWLTMRVYNAAKTVNTTLNQLPVLFSVAKGATAAETGAMVREVLAGPRGLTQTAEDIIAQATEFANQLTTLGGDLEAAKVEYHGAAAAFQSLNVANGEQNMMHTIGAHPDAMAASHQLGIQLDNFKASAAKVTAFAVINNMAQAIQALATAWKATKAQLEAVAGSDPAMLGDIAFLQSTLQLEAAAGEWAAFTEVIHNFMKVALLIR